MHSVGADQTFAPYGGHLLALEVTTGSMELTLLMHPQRLTRAVDEKTGAAVLQLP